MLLFLVGTVFEVLLLLRKPDLKEKLDRVLADTPQATPMGWWFLLPAAFTQGAVVFVQVLGMESPFDFWNGSAPALLALEWVSFLMFASGLVLLIRRGWKRAGSDKGVGPTE